jgi:ubiquitin C-terminal hydrolase
MMTMTFDYRCGQSVRAEKRLTVHQAPNLLTIQLKRFRLGYFGKVVIHYNVGAFGLQ